MTREFVPTRIGVHNSDESVPRSMASSANARRHYSDNGVDGPHRDHIFSKGAPMISTGSRLCLLGLLALCFTASGAAQDAADEISADEATAIIKRAYDLSQRAKTVAEYSGIVDACERIIAAEVDETKTDYARKLGAWAYNRRGELHAEKAAELQEQGTPDQAAEFDALALADFNRSLEFDSTKWKAFHNRGVNSALAGDFEAALADFNRVLELHTDYGNTWFNRGETHFELRQFSKAIEDYTQYLRLSPGDATALSRRGRAYAQSGQFGQAIADFNRVLQLNQADAETYVDRADASESLKQWQQAANDYRQAIRLNDQLGRAYRGAAWLMATCPNEQFRNPELALQAARKAIELDGRDNPRYLDALAAALAASGQYEQAAQELAAAVELVPEEDRKELEARLKTYQASQAFRQSN